MHKTQVILISEIKKFWGEVLPT